MDGKSCGTIQLSHVRAFTRFGTSSHIPPWIEFKHLRVLNLEFSCRISGRMPIDLIEICCDLCDKIEVPSKISGVQQLETLEIDAYKVEIPLDVAHLPRLLHLIIDGGISLPNGIGKMKSLHTLRFSQLCMSSTDHHRNWRSDQFEGSSVTVQPSKKAVGWQGSKTVHKCFVLFPWKTMQSQIPTYPTWWLLGWSEFMVYYSPPPKVCNILGLGFPSGLGDFIVSTTCNFLLRRCLEMTLESLHSYPPSPASKWSFKQLLIFEAG